MRDPLEQTAADYIRSPCVNLCRLDAAGRLCLGCRRTPAEIATWVGMSTKARRAVLARLARDR